MSSVSKNYLLKFQEALNPYGFRAYGNTFYKEVNDVLQSVMIKETRFGCSVVFNITPLAWVIEDLHIDGYNISELRNGKMKGWDWEFRPSSHSSKNANGEHDTIILSDGSKNDIATKMLSIVISFVIPFFERAVDSASALDALERYEALISYTDSFCALNKYSKYWMYLKVQDYKKAIQYLKEVIEQNKAALNYKQFDRHIKITQTENAIKYYQQQYELAVSEDPHQMRRDMLSNANINDNIKSKLLSDAWEMIFSIRYPSVAQRQKKAFERELKKLKNADSPHSKELNTMEANYNRRGHESIEKCNRLIELLSIPDVSYFQNLIMENESKSRQYLNNLG